MPNPPAVFIQQGPMLIKKPTDIPSSEITDERLFLRRREFMQLGVGLAGAAAGGVLAACGKSALDAASSDGPENALPQTPIANITKKMVTTTEPLNKFEEITGYNNYLRVRDRQGRPARSTPAQLKTSPWTVKIDGLCNKPGDYHLEDLIKTADLEERVYRFRCVEAWSMVIPWVGIPLAAVIKRADPTAKATFVEMQTVLRPTEMPGLASGGLDWPYTEGLRMDEAMQSAGDPGGRSLRQDADEPERRADPAGGAVEVRLQERQVDRPHPASWTSSRTPRGTTPTRTSTASTRTSTRRSIIRAGARRPSAAFRATSRPRKTLMFNGYSDQVASMYAGMDLKKFY